MSDTLNLHKIEQGVRRSINQDGLTYLFLGLLLLLVGLSFWHPAFRAFGGLAVLLIFPLEAIRKRITYPRIGYVRFNVPQGTIRGIVGFAAVAVVVLTLFAFFNGGQFQRYLPLVISGVFALSLYFGASMSGIRLRDWLVIGLMVVSGFVTVWLLDDWHQATAVQMWVTGSLLIIMGAIDLTRFLQKYPLPAEEQ